jgi:hypothetical protein
MRKTVIFLTIIAFIACFLIGLYLAEIVPGKGSLKGSASNNPLATPASRFQHNILIVRVDDLQAKSPALVSIWGLIIYFPEPKLIFQRIYPLSMLENDQIVSSFSLSAEKVPSNSFLRTLNESLKIVWDNYVILDAQAGDQFSAWAGGPPVSQADTGADLSQNLDVESQVLRMVCEKYAVQTPGPRDPFDWQPIIPDHLTTNIPLDFGLLSSDRLSESGLPVCCEVFNQ